MPDILKLGIAQYNARILELRRGGHHIENRTKSVDGVRHSWFRLVPDRAQIFATNQQHESKSPKDPIEKIVTLGSTDPKGSSFLDYEMGRRTR